MGCLVSAAHRILFLAGQLMDKSRHTSKILREPRANRSPYRRNCGGHELSSDAWAFLFEAELQAKRARRNECSPTVRARTDRERVVFPATNCRSDKEIASRPARWHK